MREVARHAQVSPMTVSRTLRDDPGVSEATRERVLRSLGPPDATGEDGGWSYFFASRHGTREPGTPELVFRFDGAGVVAVDCRRTTV